MSALALSVVLAVRDPDAPLPPAVLFDCWTVEEGVNAARVHVTGDLDIATTPRLEAGIEDALARVHLVVVDLGDLAFIDSSGVHALVRASTRARKAGRRVVVLRGRSAVHHLFALTGSVEHLDFGESGHPNPPSEVSGGRRVDAAEAERAAPFELTFVAGLNIAYDCIGDAGPSEPARRPSDAHLDRVRAGCAVADHPGLAVILDDLGLRARAGQLGTPAAVTAFIEEAERGVPGTSPAHGLFGGLAAGAMMHRDGR